MKNVICRICLRVIGNEIWNLSNNCDILSKLRSCFSLDLSLDKELPNQVCKDCVNKIEQINDFCVAVKENEQRLEHHVKNGSLTDYLLKLTSVKVENQDLIYNDNMVVKNENSENGTLKIDVIVQQNSTGRVKENSEPEVVKEEETISSEYNEAVYSSADVDNVTLSSLKAEKEHGHETGKQKNKCNTKDNANTVLKRSTENIIRQFNCLTCDEVCESQDKLRDHYKVVHSTKLDGTVKPLYTECIIDGKTMYKCNQCDKVYPKKFIKRHMYCHTNERPFVCKLCGRTYKTVSDIMRHGVRAHGGLKLLCAFKCGFSTAYNGALKQHENKIHRNIIKYTCKVCGKGFCTKTWFDQHQNLHTGIKPYVCDICGMAFHMDKYLTSHRSAMHPQSLSRKLLICVHCDLKCDTVNTLSLHLENEHGVARSKSRCMKKNTLCDFCGKILNRPEQLLYHRRMHLGEKPYQCSICNKGFPRKFSMQVHERAHSRERAHSCSRCGKLYSQPSALYRHQRLHHGLAR